MAAPDVGESSVSVPPNSTRTRELVSQGLASWPPLCLDSEVFITSGKFTFLFFQDVM